MESLNEHEIFLESHKEIVGLVRWMNKPIILVERGALDNAGVQNLMQGDIVFTHGNEGITTLHGGLQEDLVGKIIETFLDSHRKLQ